MKTLLQIIFLVFLSSSLTFAQVGFDNDSPDPSAVLDLSATDKGLLIPRMTTQEREAITSPANSLLVFDTSLNNYFYYINNHWVSLSQWSSSASNADIYLESGNVGIGTTTPAYSLDVNGPINTSALNISGTSFSAADLHPVSNGVVALEATGDWNDYGDTGFYMGSSLVNQPPHITGAHGWKYVTVIKHSDNYCLQYATDFNNVVSWKRAKVTGTWGDWKRTLREGENIEVGQLIVDEFRLSGRDLRISDKRAMVGFGNAAGNLLTLNYGTDFTSGTRIYGNLNVTGTVTPSSDIRLKDNIAKIDNALDKVLQIEGVYFTRVDQVDKEKRHVGFIADYLLDIVPELVEVPEDPEDMKSVNYASMTAFLVEAIKEQHQQIEELRSNEIEQNNKTEELLNLFKQQQEEINELKRRLK